VTDFHKKGRVQFETRPGATRDLYEPPFASTQGKPVTRHLRASRVNWPRSILRIGDDLSSAEHDGQQFHDNAAIHNPEKHRPETED